MHLQLLGVVPSFATRRNAKNLPEQKASSIICGQVRTPSQVENGDRQIRTEKAECRASQSYVCGREYLLVN